MKRVIVLCFFLASLTVFSQDSTKTFDYNYRNGIQLYNKGVDMTIESQMYVDSVVAQASIQFLTALPFLQAAYALNSKNEKILVALQGAYFSVNDFTNADRYKNELESLNKK